MCEKNTHALPCLLTTFSSLAPAASVSGSARHCACVRVCVRECETERKKESERVRERLCLHDLTFVSHSVSSQPCPAASIKLPFYILEKIECVSHVSLCVCVCVRTCVSVCFSNIPCETESIAQFHTLFKGLLSPSLSHLLTHTHTYSHLVLLSL